MARGYLFDGMGFVEDDKIIREEIPNPCLFGIAQQGEEKGMVENKQLGRLGAPPRRLIKAAGITPAGFWRAEVLFAADLGPELLRGLEEKIAQGAIRGGGRPFPDAF